MDKRKKNTIIKFLNIFFAIVFFVIYIIMYNTIEENSDNQLNILKNVLSWIGILIYVFSIYSWYRINKRIIDLYTIMFTFLMLFNFGQCFLWAFNIHVDGEIGSKQLFGFGIPTNKEIVLTQLLTLVGIFMFNLGAIFCYKTKEIDNREKEKNKEKYLIYKTSKILSIVIIPITFLQLFTSLIIRIKYGYSSLYYGEYVNTNLIQDLSSRMFLVCLFGLLIGTDFNKKTRKFVYLIFFIYAIISIICGDRGAWIYALCVFAFLHHNYVKKFKLKTILLIGIIGIIALNIINTMVVLRNTEINIDSINEVLNTEKNPIISGIAEMGYSMNIQTSLIMGGYDIYPYGNTYFLSILGIISDKVIKILGIEYVNLSTWFNQYYLGLENWGAGFSIVGETLINFGPYISPIIMLVLGWIISSLTYISKDTMRETPLKNMFSLISCISLITVFRGILSYNLKVYFFRIIVFYILYLIFLMKYNTNKKERDKV